MACNSFINEHRDLTGTESKWTKQSLTAEVTKQGTRCKLNNRQQCADFCQDDQSSSSPNDCDRCLANSLTCTATNPNAFEKVKNNDPGKNTKSAACCPLVFPALECSRCLDKSANSTLEGCRVENTDIWLIVGISAGGLLFVILIGYIIYKYMGRSQNSRTATVVPQTATMAKANDNFG